MGTKLSACPCGGGDYANCCGGYHNGAPAPDAETLMRSRYSAYVLKLEGYLLATWHPGTRPATLNLAGETTKWLGLQVKKHAVESSDRATVEFIARYKTAGRAHKLHEISRFVREDGHWLYVDGKFPG
ncbi:MAG: YchJ family metal-binding protein [Gallionella sp.]|nr:YchJ family metal-binding protein [Gallionella sp.]